MINNPKITIGIPVYNADKHIRLSIQSVLNQSFNNFELIISDDGSTDNSLSIIKSFDDNRITIIADGTNHGISYRLNEQINRAKGEYFVRMDADDIMFPNRVQKQLDYLELNPNIDVVGSQCIIIDDNNYIIGCRSSIVPNSFNEVLKRNVFIHPTVMGKTSWFKKFYYTENLKGVEDYDLWVRSFKVSNFSILNENLLFYRDPLEIKLRTYQYRHKQARKAYRYYRKLYINSITFSRLYILSLLKTIVYTIAHKVGFSIHIAANRNLKLSSHDITLYRSTLQSITK